MDERTRGIEAANAPPDSTVDDQGMSIRRPSPPTIDFAASSRIHLRKISAWGRSLLLERDTM